MNNVTAVTAEETARTQTSVALARAYRLASIGVEGVVEACVGPSYELLADAYAAFFIDCDGLDIDPKWERTGVRIADALTIDYSTVYPEWHVVFAPPLSAGCTGRREDSLSVDWVVPRYVDHLNHMMELGQPFSTTLVLPGRTFSVKGDRAQFHKLMADIWSFSHDWDHVGVTRMMDQRNRVVKYVEIDLFHRLGHEE